MSAPAVGIDLGTTNSVVAVSIGGRPQVLTDASGFPLVPSVVSFTPEGTRIVGRPARVRRPLDPAHTVSSVKRLLGRPYKSEEVRRARSRVAFELKEGPDSSVLVSTRAGEFSLPELSAMVLREVRRIAEDGLQEKVEKCVITVPANFNELQRSSTKIAGRIAELDVIRILNEPTAAALAYGYGRGTREKICIFDFGGGTFDVTLLELSGNVFEVLATAGDTFLGGDDIDIAITDSLIQPFQRATKIDAARDRIAYDVLRDAVETAKCELSTTETARVSLDARVPGRPEPVRFQHTLTRADLEKLSASFVSRTFDVCGEALKLAGLRATDLTAVILVGGSTRIPAVRQRVASFFGRDPLTSLPPEEVVALGASILAEALTGGSRRAVTRPLGSPPSRTQPPAASSPTSPPAGSNTQVDSPRSTLTGVAPGAAPGGRPGARTLPPPLPPGVGAAPTAPPLVAAPAPSAPPPAASFVGDVTFDLDDPFADKPTVALATGPVSAAEAAEARRLSRPRDSDMMWEPAVGAQGGSLGNLDEPSFMGRAPSISRPDIPVVESREPGARTGSVPAFNLDDPSVVAPMPRGDVGEATTEQRAPLVPSAPMAPQSAAAAREVSVPSFQLDDFAVPPAAPAGGAPERREHSVPSFNLHAEDLFAGAATIAQPTPVVTGGSGARSNPGAPVIPPAMPTARGVAPAVGNTTQRMSAAQPPVVPPAMRSGMSSGNSGMAAGVVAGAAGMAAGMSAGNSGMAAGMSAGNSGMANRPGLPPGGSGARPNPAPPPPASPLRAPTPAPGSLGSMAPLLLDVTPFSLGVETAGGLCESVVKRNATIPVEQTRVFATTNDGQDSVVIRIAQGESRRFVDNQFLGELELPGLRPAARGEVTIAVTFELEADGTLKVGAKDIESGREQVIRVTLITLPTEAQQVEMTNRSRAGATAAT